MLKQQSAMTEAERQSMTEQVCFAMQLKQGLYRETSEKWISLAESQKNAVKAQRLCGLRQIELPESVLKTLEEPNTIVEVIVQESSPRVKLFLKLGGEGKKVNSTVARGEKINIVTMDIEGLAGSDGENVVTQSAWDNAIDVIAGCLGTSGFNELIEGIVSCSDESESDTEAFPTSRLSECSSI